MSNADELLVAEGMLDADHGDVSDVEGVENDAGSDVGAHANMGNGVDDADDSDRGSSLYADSVNGHEDDDNGNNDAEHVWMHLGQMIRRMGMVWNYSMQSAEWAHKHYLKGLLGKCRVVCCPGAAFVRRAAPSSPSCLAALTNFKHFLAAVPQIYKRIQFREFAVDVVLEISSLKEGTKRALLGLPASAPVVDADDADSVAGEFGFTSKDTTTLSAQHPLLATLKISWTQAVRSAFVTLTGNEQWPPVGVPPLLLADALPFDPAAAQLYRGLKIVRPGVSNSTLRCSPLFHGRPRYDTAQLNRPTVNTKTSKNSSTGLFMRFFLIVALGWSICCSGVPSASTSARLMNAWREIACTPSPCSSSSCSAISLLPPLLVHCATTA